ncbi:OOP family OmpA-OmpF porin [Sphingomonas sp. BE138]|uniref:OmpA family protein n=1 Tax=Sphingomonas sp. BE138 TaxID=2817845 RepID=UPI002866CC3F|nr:OmpA family protein [Sphingomonas sp. BE138]MDR6787874.1 OOP family OmpA-OmpF porin [Sphingomonas sp. BE138]
MSKTINTATATLALILAACSPPAQQASRNDTAPDNAAAAIVANDAGVAAPTKSILRPEVAEPEPEEAALQPLDVVISFDERGTALPDASRARLDDMIASPTFQAGGTVTVRGHSDTRGGDRANLAASRRRAELVRAYLIGKDVDPARLTVIALGETTPLVPNAHPDGSDDPAARARNRRVEVHVALPATASPDGAPDDGADGNAS